jgi:hypothetical protein
MKLAFFFLDLCTSVIETKSSLNAFISDRRSEVVEWSLKQAVMTDKELHELWHRRFIKRIKTDRPEIVVK